jgi:hypothetical protein
MVLECMMGQQEMPFDQQDRHFKHLTRDRTNAANPEFLELIFIIVFHANKYTKFVVIYNTAFVSSKEVSLGLSPVENFSHSHPVGRNREQQLFLIFRHSPPEPNRMMFEGSISELAEAIENTVPAARHWRPADQTSGSSPGRTGASRTWIGHADLQPGLASGTPGMRILRNRKGRFPEDAEVENQWMPPPGLNNV